MRNNLLLTIHYDVDRKGGEKITMKHRRARGQGGVYKQPTSDILWIYYTTGNGVRVRESTGTKLQAEAYKMLNQRLADIAKHKPVGPAIDKTTFRDLMDIVEADYQANGRKMKLNGIIGHLTDTFGCDLAIRITGDRIAHYKVQRQQEKAANATINRELAVLKRAFKLAKEFGKLGEVPAIHLLAEDNVRKGFLEPEKFEEVVPLLPRHYHAAVRCAYLTGWRIHSEIFTRQPKHLDLKNGWLRLEPGEAKNRDGRLYPLTDELRQILTAQVEYTRRLEREQGRIIPWLFHRQGEPIKGFRKAWISACRRAGVPGAQLHDFRRSASRNHIRDGCSVAEIMTLMGHKTIAMFKRYAIVEERMLKEAAEKINHAKKVAG
jgi:integrase